MTFTMKCTIKQRSAGILVSAVILTMAGLFGCSPAPEPEIRTVTAETAAEDAVRLRNDVSVTLAEGFELNLWASEKLMADAIALDMDDQGRALISVTNRSLNSELDIRNVPSHWYQETIKLTSVEERREFLHRELAPENSDENTWINDFNEDGSHDWRDLAVNQEEVWRLEDSDNDGLADRSQLFIRDFNEEITDVAGAVLLHNDDVFLGVGPDMWRIQDRDGDGYGERKESISHGYNVHVGFSGHGMSGAVTGPDGMIYWGIGDPGINITDQEGNHWYNPHSGVIVRSEPDGSNFEVFATGVRNTHEFVFDKYGNLISVDNDGDHPGEMERVVYLVNGSDSGWRINWQFGKYTDPSNNTYKVWMDEDYFLPRFEEQAAHILPPVANYHSGPAGMAYNPGTALSDEWEDHFFIMSFRGGTANSPLQAFTLEENGAGFDLASDREVLRGVLPVGIDFGPDGALYLTDWIQGWNLKEEGRIWKLDTPETAGSQEREQTQRLLEEDLTERDTAGLMELLANEDMRVRQKAQFELVSREDDESLLSVLSESDNQLARIHGIWGIAQLGRENLDVVDALIPYLQDEDPEIRAQSAKMLGDVRYEPAGENLTALIDDEDPRVRFFATEAVGRIAFRPAFDAIVSMLEMNNDEDVYLRHAGAIAMARIDDEEAVADLNTHSSRAVRIAAVVALKNLKSPAVERFLADDDEFIVTNAARAISDDEYIEEAIPALARILDQERFMNEPLIRRAINANLYTGGEESARRLVEFALRDGVADVLRVEALNTLASWTSSSEFDRVTGMYRGTVENDPAAASRALGPLAESLEEGSGSAFLSAAAETLSRLEYAQAMSPLRDLFEASTGAEVRIAAMAALQGLGYEQMEEVIQQALSAPQAEIRMSALGMLPELSLSDEATASLLATVLESGEIAEQQVAIEMLGSLGSDASHAVLDSEMDQLIAGNLAPELQLDLILAIENSGSSELEERLEQYEADKPQDDPLALHRESLRGGNVNEGRRIFNQHPVAQCIRCHAVNERGGDAGPDLGEVADSQTREQLLISLLEPSRELSPGFGTVTLTLSNGEEVRGVLEAETETTITVASGGDEVRTVNKSDIENRENVLSAMPPMGDILSRTELRDVLEYMSTLTSDN